MISIDRVGVTVGAFLTRVADAGIIQLAQQSWNTVQNMDFMILVLGSMTAYVEKLHKVFCSSRGSCASTASSDVT